MFALNSRKVLIAALLATALSAPVSANESGTTTQQSAVGQTAPDVASLQSGPVIAEESYETVTSARVSPPAARPKVAELRPRPSIAAVRQPSGGGYEGLAEQRPLILGIGY